ncbi:hypothetical protein AXG93_4461s1230 [Marchantia polymorpha subsp. ruderalis]|uniref:Uncharacterized protein n=1 Tax=Marchantia polymorpha subsp. ruderalis TaxID=1480154 RepID=A0A176WQP2_MARPO|nr:hypothetical protein AXG93_4461s1230 [Marchantia polymorpha subsp. ruderalis]
MRQAHVREANIVQYEYMGGVGVQYGYGWPSSMRLWLRAWAWAWLGITPRGSDPRRVCVSPGPGTLAPVLDR